jgi:hypothetical protein
LPKETLTGIAPARGSGRRDVAITPPKLLDAGVRLERDALAAAVAHAAVRSGLHELDPEHFDVELHRRFRAALVNGGAEDDDLVALHAELDALGEREGIDEATGKELLLRLRERRLRRDLSTAAADPGRAKELQTQLARVREALETLA